MRRDLLPSEPRQACRLSSRVGHGFSLLELLISVVLGTALVSSVFYVITAQIRGSTSEELAQRSRDDATRLNYLIQTEASEAVTMATGVVISNCASPANGKTSVFSLTIPRTVGQFDDVTNVATIFYYSDSNSGVTDLRRCGPAILRNGSLDFSSSVDGIVSASTTLSLATCNGSTSSNREVVYQLQFNDVPGGYLPPCAIARAKAFRVVDP